MAEEIEQRINELEEKMKIVTALVRGDEALRIKGLAERMGVVEDLLQQLLKEKQDLANTLRGIVIGLAFTGITGVGTLITVVTQLLGG